jgi:predicted nuclease of predicted toxin-antitoxin system
VKFLVDNQLPPALARFIHAQLGCEGRHVADVGLTEASDFTHMVLRSSNGCLIGVRVGNCRRVFLLDLFRRLWPNLLERLESGDRFVEIR